jgi:hypothetical protein
MRKTVLAVIFIAGSLVGCNRESAEPEPMNALRSSKALIESNYGPDFWHDQYQRSTELWREAASYCNAPDHRHTENCELVLSITEQVGGSIGTPLPYPKSWSAPSAPHAGLSGLPPQGWPPATP